MAPVLILDKELELLLDKKLDKLIVFLLESKKILNHLNKANLKAHMLIIFQANLAIKHFTEVVGL